MKIYNHNLNKLLDACGMEKDDADYVIGVLDELITSTNSASQVVELIENRIKSGDDILLRMCITGFISKMTMEPVDDFNKRILQ